MKIVILSLYTICSIFLMPITSYSYIIEDHDYQNIGPSFSRLDKYRKNSNNIKNAKYTYISQDEIERNEQNRLFKLAAAEDSQKEDIANNTIKSQKKEQNITKNEEKSNKFIELFWPKMNPWNINGTYRSLKLFVDVPLFGNEISAYENRNTDQGDVNKVHLANATSVYVPMPSLSIAVGSDTHKWYRWEVELGILNNIAASIKNIETNTIDNSGSSMDIDSKTLNRATLYLMSNHYLQISLTQKVLGFVGAGVGVGFAIPYNQGIEYNLVLPVAQLLLGFSLAPNEKSKISMFARVIYQDFKLHTSDTFHDNNGKLQDGRPLQDSYINIQNNISLGAGIEYQWR